MMSAGRETNSEQVLRARPAATHRLLRCSVGERRVDDEHPLSGELSSIVLLCAVAEVTSEAPPET